MSDAFEMLIDPEVSVEDAKEVSLKVLKQFRKLGLITGPLTKDCVLGGKGYRAGPEVPRLYKVGKRECGFWELITNGVEPKVGRGFNYDALGEACDGFTCPTCKAFVQPFDEQFQDAVGKAIGEWMDESGTRSIACPHCRKRAKITKWQCKPPLGFGNLAFRFWNWPSFDSPSWQIDIPALFREITGHEPVRSYGHI